MLRNLRNRRLVELVPLCDCEEFVIDIHAVFLGLACVSEIGGPAVRSCSPHRTGTCRCPSGSRGRCGHFPGSCYFERARADCEHWSVTTLFGLCVLCGLVQSKLLRVRGASAEEMVAQSGGQGCTHPFDAIVTIGAAGLREKPRGRGNVA
jgi:hypothetical protein